VNYSASKKRKKKRRRKKNKGRERKNSLSFSSETKSGCYRNLWIILSQMIQVWQNYEQLKWIPTFSNLEIQFNLIFKH